MDVPGKNKAVAGLVLGIVSAVAAWTGYGAAAGIIVGIVGIILCIGAKKEMKAVGYTQTGMATAGLVLSIIGVALSALLFTCTLCVVCAVSSGINNLTGLSGLY